MLYSLQRYKLCQTCTLLATIEPKILRTKISWFAKFPKQVIFGIKTHGRVSVAKKDVRHTSMLFTRTAKSPFFSKRFIAMGDASTQVRNHFICSYCIASCRKFQFCNHILIFIYNLYILYVLRDEANSFRRFKI